VESDLVDALDREGPFRFLFTLLLEPNIPPFGQMNAQASIFGTWLELSPQARKDVRSSPAVSPLTPAACINQTASSDYILHPHQKVRHAGFRLVIAGLEQAPSIQSPTSVLPLSFELIDLHVCPFSPHPCPPIG
jgi:hypothetical protein